MKLEGKTVLLTGASRGIGRALAEEFEDRGARVLAGRRDDGPGVWIDLGSRETIDESCDALGEELRRVDVLVNNAGAFTGGQLESQDLDEIYNLFQVNLTGLVHLTRRVLPAMLERGSGKIVNHSSLVAYFRFPGISTYSASKAGVTAFTESLRRELRGTGVSTLEVVTAGRLDGQADSSGWQWMSPDEWAKRIADAIESDRRVLQPPGRSRLGKELARGPAFVLDAISAKGFRRQ
jgi:uncharacterized protein